MKNFEYFDFEGILLLILTALNFVKTARRIYTYTQTLEILKHTVAHSYFVYLLERIDTHMHIYTFFGAPTRVNATTRERRTKTSRQAQGYTGVQSSNSSRSQPASKL
uniref:Uncharacterized protein n=1 Tax=Bactrocera latifrons TaxID=174628 RepID=A0A0K8WAE4_BACLA